MKKRNMKVFSLLLAASMTVPQLADYSQLSGLTVVHAAVNDQVSEKAVTEVWRHFTSGATNDNAKNPAVLKNTNENAIDPAGGEISLTLKTSQDAAVNRIQICPYWVDGGNFINAAGFDASSKWFFEYKADGLSGNWPGLGVSEWKSNEEVPIIISWKENKYTVTINGQKCAEQTVPQEFLDALKGGSFAIKAGTWGKETTDIYFKDVQIKNSKGVVVVEKGADTWEVSTGHGEVFEEGKEVTTVSLTGKVVDKDKKPVAGATVTVGDKSTTTGEDGAWTIEGIEAGEVEIVVSKDGYKNATTTATVEKEDLVIDDITLSTGDAVDFEGAADETISSDEMKVSVDSKFPRVAGYEILKGNGAGKKMYGQTEKLDTIVLNQTKADDTTGIAVKPEVTSEKNKEGNKMVYTMKVDDKENNIHATIKAELVVKKNTLAFNIKSVEREKGSALVKTINIPNHNLVSVRTTQAGARFDGANMSNNTQKSGDTHQDVASMKAGKTGYMYAFVSSSDLSAGLWSNSENNVNADWQRVVANAAEKDGYHETGLSSNYWTWQKGEDYREESEDYELPSTKIAITADENSDTKVDWQDGAIAYRDIMNNPKGSKLVPDRTAIRIAMNFSSQAQNPFLMTLDNVKKVYLNTDGLGQSVLLKGYGSEGHDSGHLNYADIGTRIGGAEDMTTLMKEGAKYGATFGIHVNASETYPESIYFEEDRLMKGSNGKYSYGWNWLDQGININADYDLKNGREQRFLDLKEKLDKADPDGKNDLDFIYVDVWGNGQSGDNGTWASRQLAKEITEPCDWRLAGEWGHANEYDSTFQHWAADLTYGGASNKGINSSITRFIRNHQKDSWVGDYPSYGGAAVNPLLGGYDMKDFEGWQGRNDYKGYIENLFDDDVSTKFLQHYEVMQWVDGEPTTVAGSTWTPEMKVVLQDKERKQTVTVERQSNNGNDAGYSLRTMKFDDGNGERVIMDGEKYLIPWYWDANGESLGDNYKLYHWNQAGGTSTWKLPAGWENAKIYELTENGKKEVTNATVANGQITIDATAKTPYVLYKTEAKNPTNEELEWSKGTHLVDTGFNSASLEQWTITGEKEAAQIIHSAGFNPMLRLNNQTNEVVLEQKATGLEAGKQYVAMVGVDNRSDAKAYLEVVSGDKTESNYTTKSIAKNYSQADAHNTNASNATIEGQGSYFQNMYVFFTADKNGEATIRLKREKGEGEVYFDDLRIVQNDSENFPSEGKFVQNFETVPQGLWPFVVGGAEGVTDNRTHLSEKNKKDPKYTSAGWYTKKLDDVLEGDWSLKTNGLTQRGNLIYQTIPQNFRFEEGVTYNVSFDYQCGSEGTYALAVGNGNVENGNVEYTPLESSIPKGQKAETKHYKFRITGAEGGQSWFGIQSTTKAADLQGTSGGDADFGGYKDFVLDNLVIEKSKAQKANLETLVAENQGRYEVNYSAKTWKTFTEAMKAANEALDNFDADQATVDKAYENLDKAIKGLEVIGATMSGTVTDKEGRPIENITVSVKMKDKTIKTVTNSRGQYILPGVLFGDWKVTADSPIWAKATADVKVSKDNLEFTQDFQLEDTQSSVEGHVTAVGKNVEGATVSLTGKSKPKEVKTDATGAYKFDKLLAGTYTLKVEKEGYDTFTQEITVTKEKGLVQNVMLQPVSTVDYENDYSNGKKTWDNLAGNTTSTTISVENEATKIIFPGGGHANAYETAAPTFKNGVVEMDVTPQKSGIRLGLLLRANGMNDRIYVGVGDAEDKWFAEYWGSDGSNSWSNMYSGPKASAGKTLHLKAEIIDTTVSLWVDDQLVINKLNMGGMPTKAGAVGMNTRNSNNVTVDNVKVTSYDLPEGEVETVSGHVTDKNGKALEGVSVNIKSAEGAAEAVDKTAKTDALGNYKFKNIPLGNYTVTATKGKETKTVDFAVAATDDYVVVPEIRFGAEASGVDKTNLKAAITMAESKDKADYLSIGWAEFEAALQEAKAVAADANATFNQVNDAEEKLIQAMNVLVKVPEKDGLKAAIDAAKEKKETDYTPETWAPFAKALAVAEEVYANPEATEEMVQDAVNALLEASEGLEAPKPSKDALEKAIKEAKELKKEDYTAASWKEFSNALQKAQAVYDKADATAEEIAKAVADLETAQKNLVEKDGWSETTDGWEYYEDGKKVTGWKEISKHWYYFSANGIMATGWTEVGEHWYYMDQWGAMMTGWVSVDGHWYYMDQWGAMTTGWTEVNGHYYYMDQWGAMMTGWVSVDGHWYYLNADGAMATGWVYVNGHYYYMDQWGAMMTGWVHVTKS